MPKEQEFELARTPHLYRAAWLLCADAHRAEDLVQETLAKVYVRWTRTLGRQIDNPAAYAQTTLVRTFISVRLALAAALAELEPMDRAVLVLRFLHDVSVADTAHQLDISQGAVRNRSMCALERLRTLLGSSLPDLLLS